MIIIISIINIINYY